MAHVAPQTREVVMRAAVELGYPLPSRDRPGLVGVLVRFPTQWFFTHTVAAVEHTLCGTGFAPVLYNIGDPAGRRWFFEHVVPARELDALVVVATSFDEAERAALDGLDVPIVVVGGYAPGLMRVGIDDVEGARVATRHLLALGHRDIGLIGFAPEGTVGEDTSSARRKGLAQALDEAGVSQCPEWTVERESTVRGGIRAAEDLLSLPRLPSAVFAMTDEMALGALWTLRRAGIAVPGQMSMIGFDDHEMAEFSDLTTIRQPVREQAEKATAMLLDRLAGGPGAGGHLELPTRLVVRRTTGPPRG
jgi:DNA-binding LacI/PurR family transcriptional regulator